MSNDLRTKYKPSPNPNPKASSPVTQLVTMSSKKGTKIKQRTSLAQPFLLYLRMGHYWKYHKSSDILQVFRNGILTVGKGNSGTWGTAFEVRVKNGEDTRVYVLKIMDKFDTMFINEVLVGSSFCKETNSPGVCVHAYLRDVMGQSAYIMDHVVKSRRNNNNNNGERFITRTLHEYVYDNRIGSEKKAQVLDQAKEAIKTFWTDTGGFHGDLHWSNILVIIDKTRVKKPQVKIIDYGSFMPFQDRNKTVQNIQKSSWNNALKIVNRQFQNMRRIPKTNDKNQNYNHNTFGPVKINDGVVRYTNKYWNTALKAYTAYANTR